jgi:glycosyltransferase involved in cell wall biosynthesis
VTTNHGPFATPGVSSYYAAIASRVPVIAISRHHAATAAPTPIAAIIYHAVDVERFPVGSGDGGYALFLGRMHPDKGVAAAARAARTAGVPLVIAAKMREPQEVAYFEAEVQPLLGTGVEYIGEIGREQKLRVLRDAVCLLNPIRWPEPFGMVMIEALATGTPVVATPCGSAPELIEHGVTGYLADTEVALANSVTAAASLDRHRCRRVAEARFSSARLVEEHVALYERVASGERVAALT